MPPVSTFPDQSSRSNSTRRRARILAGWFTAGLLVVGLPGVESTWSVANAQVQTPISSPRRTSNAEQGKLDATAAGPGVGLVIEVRPEALLKLPIYQRFADQIPEDSKEVKAFKSGAIEQVLVLVSDLRPRNDPAGRGAPPRPVFVLRSARPYDWRDFISAKVDEVAGDGFTYLRTSRGRGELACYRVIDDRTLLVGFSEGDVSAPPLNGGRPKGGHAWDLAWSQLPPGPIRVAVDGSILARFVPPGREGMGFQVISPLLDEVKAYAMTIDVKDGLTVDARAISANPNGAERVGETLRAIQTLSRNIVPAIRRQIPKAPPQAAQMSNNLVDAFDTMLSTARIEQDQATTRLQIKADGITVVTATALLLPAIQAAREAARRAESINNLKQIGLAMHWFQNSSNSFPAAKGYGRDGKTRHSWRVDLLPFVEEVALYNEYNFDEPWDGPNNSKLIERMPKVFHAPSDTNAKPGVPSYFAATGPDTLFPDRKAGMAIAEVLDGTANTIAVVEAKRDIPWTKPEDIPFEGEGPLPQLGGISLNGFNALFADGSVRFLKTSINPVLFRALLSPAGGEVISADAY